MSIQFGTDGWRAVIAEDFTMSNVVLVAGAVAAMLREHGKAAGGAVVGYDRRFMSEVFAHRCAQVLSARGVPVLMCARSCPTPAVSFAVRAEGAALGIIVTASHNPCQYNGIKLRAGTGAPLDAEDRAWIERWTAPPPRGVGDQLEARLKVTPHSGAARGIRLYDPWPRYRAHVARLVDLEAIGAGSPAVIHDAMHGSAAGWIQRLVPSARTLRGTRDPLFGGAAPEPLAKNLAALIRRVRRSSRPVIGLATDGDGDRLAAIAEDGTYVDSHHLLALLYLHLVKTRGLKGRAVRTVTTSALVDRVAGRFGLPVDVTPVGFSHVAGRFAGAAGEPEAIIGGEESGGIGFPLHLPERDGIFAALMLLECLAMADTSLTRALDCLVEFCGGDSYLERRDIRFPGGPGAAVAAEGGCRVPETLLGSPVTRWHRIDGLGMETADGRRLHVRASRTEPVLRLYAEAGSREEAEALLVQGATLVRADDPGLHREVYPVAP